MNKSLNLRANIALGLIFAFLVNTFGPLPLAQAQELSLPVPGAMVNLSPAFEPVLIKGLRIHPENPFRFDFIIATGHTGLRPQDPQLKEQSSKLIKYFLASLTIP